MTTTGIPIEALFAVLGFLLAGIYADVKRDLRTLRKGGIVRDRKMDRIGIVLGLVCQTLKVPFSDILKGHDDDDHAQ
jgi:hypothetical protein